MAFLFSPPINLYISVALLVIAAVSLCFSVQRFISAYNKRGEYVSAVWFIRGIRFMLIGLTAATWSAGFFWTKSWLLIIGLVIICQELFEGTILGIALKKGNAIEKGNK
ncbi:MAG: hypothetical protein HF978_15085 [Desulfobacteraceae bacterium]|nr:hypothetical protein [Desulfobacteraceae bacterium]MBC2756865.1 hypothetical protein [Desulfobacteraceae bacterium]